MRTAAVIILVVINSSCNLGLTPASFLAPPACFGDFLGTYTGNQGGTFGGYIRSPDGYLTAQFDSNNPLVQPRAVTGGVGADGAVIASGGTLYLTGHIDFDTCEASGEWNQEGFSGTWTAHLVNP